VGLFLFVEEAEEGGLFGGDMQSFGLCLFVNGGRLLHFRGEVEAVVEIASTDGVLLEEKISW